MNPSSNASRAGGLKGIRLDDLVQRWSEEDDGGPVAVALHREWANPTVVAHFSIPGEPQSKSRARVTTRGGKTFAYTPKQTEAAEAQIALRFRQAGGRGPDAASTFGVFAAFMCGTRQRRDVDNMLKLILDGLNKIAWADDSQVTEVSARLVRGLGADNARTEVIVYITDSQVTGGLMQTKPCEHCARPIRVYDSTKSIRFCSRKCAGEAKRVHEAINCLNCDREFLPGSLSRVCCSKECDAAARTITRQCAHCQTTITGPRSWNRKFCDVACAGAWKRGRPRGARA